MSESSLADRVRAAIDGRGAVREVSMFGGLSFMLDDVMLVAVRGDSALLVRVDPTRSEELLTQVGAEQAFMGTGRTMGASWVSVDGTVVADDARLQTWLDLALERHAQR